MREYLLVFLVALSVTYLLTVVAREIALRTGAVAAVRDRDVHAEPIPYLGGLAMLGGLYAAYLVARHLPFLSTSEEFVFPDAGAVLLAGALVCAVGVIDDIFDLDALTKLGGQVLAAGLLITQGVRFYYFPGADGTQFSLDDVQGAVLTLLVVIGTMNAVNFVDGLDGLAAGIVGIGAAAFFLYCYTVSFQNNLTLVTTGALLSAALAGACPVDLVDEQQGGDAQPLQDPHQHPGLPLHAFDRGDDEDRPVEDAEGTLDLGDEVRVAGGVDQVDREVPECERDHGGLDGDAALPLEVEEVGAGAAVVHAADLVDDAGEEQEAFGEAGLTGVDVRQDAEVEGAQGRSGPSRRGRCAGGT